VLADEASRIHLLSFISFSTKRAIKFHTNPYMLPLKWSAGDPELLVQQPRDLVHETVIFPARGLEAFLS